MFFEENKPENMKIFSIYDASLRITIATMLTIMKEILFYDSDEGKWRILAQQFSAMHHVRNLTQLS